MKYLKFLLYSMLLLGLATLTSCDDDDDSSDDPQNIVEVAQDNDLSLLVEALEITGLTSTIETSEPLTVFAPTNAAFEALLNSTPAWNSLEDIDKATLSNVLKFHVLAAEVRSTDLTDSYTTTLATGPNNEQIVLQIDVTGGVKFNGDASPVITDVEASNGVVHVIDKVMLPPSVVNLALNNPNFSILVDALTRSDLSSDFVATLSGTGPFTVFAPTNAAFQALLDSNPSWNSLDDIPAGTLEAVLAYHVVGNANVQSDELSDDQAVTTLGGDFIIDLSGEPKIETSSSQSVSIVLTDVQGSNGVIHVVNEVLLP